MEKECVRCHRTFYTSQEEATQCADCLKAEFQKPAAALGSKERNELLNEFGAQDKRQQVRAVRMSEEYRAGLLFGWTGQLRFVFGCALFIIVALIFSLMGGSEQEHAFDSLGVSAQRVMALFLSFVAAMLVYTSSSRRVLTYPIVLVMLASGWFLPDLAFLDAAERIQPEEEVTEEQAEEQTVEEDRALKRSDLDVFYQQKKEDSHGVHYAVYMSSQDAHTRTIVRDALCRLTGAEYTRAYTRNDGALFVISHTRGKLKNISRILNRFGTITYAEPSEGIYELRFDPEKVNMVSRYPVEVLTNPSNSTYVSANIEELLSLDPMRIRSAAKHLQQSNVQMLRNEVRETLLVVMQDPWNSDYDTYSALAEASTVYAIGDKDAAVVDACRKFFRFGLQVKREIPESVTKYLIAAVPDEMVEPVVAFWCENPIAWTESIASLGLRSQDALLAKLRETNNIRLIGNIIRHLKGYGDARAVNDIKVFLNHKDAIIRHTAQDAIRAIESRNS